MNDTNATDNLPPERRRTAFKMFLRVYGVLTLAIFTLLVVGFVAQSPLLAEHGGTLNWTIWNDTHCGGEHLHVPPMLMVIYIVWGVFLLRAAQNPEGYRSFLNFTAWANLAHGALMVVQAGSELNQYWSKFFTDIPFVVILSLGIYLWQRTDSSQHRSPAIDDALAGDQ
jgi:FtsH-binding integral membrane protein